MGYSDGSKGLLLQNPDNSYYMTGYQKGRQFTQEFSESDEKTNTIDDRF